jgi:serine/threonine protein phosphatase PrpC
MDITYFGFSSPGPVRQNNEDYLAFWQPTDPEEVVARGSACVIADGVGGNNHGEVASSLAAETAIQVFKDSKSGMAPSGLLWQMFNAANLAVYDRGMQDRTTGGRMATTLSITLFRNNEINIGHVGDTRVYLIQDGVIRCLTTDHSYIAFHAKMGLMTGIDAANSPMGGALTRSIGKEPTIRVDTMNHVVNVGDYVIHCTDGLHNHVTEHEIIALVKNKSPKEACQDLIGLAHARGTEDNVSVQVIRIDKVEQITYYRGTPVVQQQEAQPATSSEVEVGQVVDDRFEIVSLISRSGMASVFKAKDRTDGQTVVLKVPFMQFESDPAFFSRFEREEAIGKRMDHPYILHIVPVDPDKRSRPYIAMEYLDGQTLDRATPKDHPMPIEQAVNIAARICEALEHMHGKTVIHRDLKPQNIMLCRDGSIRIMDFGIAKAAGMRRITFTGFSPAMGTPDYMAPEQVKGKRGDERTDIYSLGAILYELVTGSVPFEGANPFLIMNARLTGDPVAPRKLNPAISEQLEETILHAMERNPAERFASATALADELLHPEKVHLTGRHLRLQKPMVWKSRWRTFAWGFAAAMVPIAIFLIIFLVSRAHSK